MITSGSFTPDAADWRLSARTGDFVEQYRDTIRAEGGASTVPVAETAASILVSSHEWEVARGEALLTPHDGAGGLLPLTETYVRNWAATKLPGWVGLKPTDFAEVVRIARDRVLADQARARAAVPEDVRRAQELRAEQRRFDALEDIARRRAALDAELAALDETP